MGNSNPWGVVSRRSDSPEVGEHIHTGLFLRRLSKDFEFLPEAEESFIYFLDRAAHAVQASQDALNEFPIHLSSGINVPTLLELYDKGQA